jgi:MFS family permease
LTGFFVRRLRTPRAETVSARAYVVLAIGVGAYTAAIFQRFSLGVAGPSAQGRFGISAAQLSTFAVVQLLVYAGMQIPVGVLVDRFGARRLIALGALVMATGQAGFALSHDFRAALLARVLIGAGDGMTFISVLRLMIAWFPPRWNPVLVQVIGQVGALGAVVSANPLVASLEHFGWQETFLAAAGVSVLACAAVLAGVRAGPPGWQEERLRVPLRDEVRRVRASVRAAWDEPGTKLGLVTHLVTMFPGLVFTVLWGFPFLVQGEGLSSRTAGALLMLLTVSGMVIGPLLGSMVGRLPFYRSWLVLGVVGAAAGAWTAVLAWPGRVPLWVLVLLVLSLATTGPASAIGFDYARTFNPSSRVGTATGIVNVGGFVAAVATIAVIGFVLDRASPLHGHYTLSSLKLAFSSQYAVWALGVVGVLRLRRTTRATHELSRRRPLPTLEP